MNITHNRLVTRLPASLITVVLSIGLASNAGAAELPDFADLVEKNKATIVHISTVRQVESRRPILGPELEEQLR
ncbi:MAG: hypothetical protein QGG54_04985, partial [Gammaproteobacteria bacterium]|nr:hypothetical protein [Gammaproteobacteria bacterium]